MGLDRRLARDRVRDLGRVRERERALDLGRARDRALEVRAVDRAGVGRLGRVRRGVELRGRLSRSDFVCAFSKLLLRVEELLSSVSCSVDT